MAISCVVIGIQTTCKHKIVHVQCRTCYQQHVIYLIEEICIEIRTFEKMKNPHLQFILTIIQLPINPVTS